MDRRNVIEEDNDERHTAPQTQIIIGLLILNLLFSAIILYNILNEDVGPEKEELVDDIIISDPTYIHYNSNTQGDNIALKIEFDIENKDLVKGMLRINITFTWSRPGGIIRYQYIDLDEEIIQLSTDHVSHKFDTSSFEMTNCTIRFSVKVFNDKEWIGGFSDLIHFDEKGRTEY